MICLRDSVWSYGVENQTTLAASSCSLQFIFNAVDLRSKCHMIYVPLMCTCVIELHVEF